VAIDSARYALRAVTAVVKVLKARFINLSGDEVAMLAANIVEAIIEANPERDKEPADGE
jgi:hypothetical protein